MQTTGAFVSKELLREEQLLKLPNLNIASAIEIGEIAKSFGVIRDLPIAVEVRLGDWWRVVLRELPAGIILGLLLGAIAFGRILVWDALELYNYGPHSFMIAVTVGLALVGIVLVGSLTGSMLPFLLKRFNFDPASASAPLVATIVDVSAISIYFGIAFQLLSGTLL